MKKLSYILSKNGEVHFNVLFSILRKNYVFRENTNFLNTGTRDQFDSSKSGSAVKNIVYKNHLGCHKGRFWPSFWSGTLSWVLPESFFLRVKPRKRWPRNKCQNGRLGMTWISLCFRFFLGIFHCINSFKTLSNTKSNCSTKKSHINYFRYPLTFKGWVRIC